MPWNRQPDLLGGLEIDDELELGRLLYGQFRWVGTFQNLVYVPCGTPLLISIVGRIGHKSTGLYILISRVH